MPMRRRLFSLLLACLAACVIVVSRPAALRGDDDVQLIATTDRDTCLTCHGEVVDSKVFGGSAHGSLDCQLCHAGVDRYPHPEKAIAKMPACVSCHQGKADGLAHSVHARFGKSATANTRCTTCHGTKAHAITPMSKLTPAQREAATCAKCHGAQRTALAGSVHATGTGTPRCVTCHGDAHTVTPPTAVLGKKDASCWQCHGDQAKMIAGSAHGLSSDHATQRLDCLACHGGNPHGVRQPGARADLPDAACRRCHTDIAQRLAGSAHGHLGAVTGKKTGCLSCHGDQPHAIAPTRHMTTLEKSAVCESCHADRAQQLVSSAHGKARLKDGKHVNCLTCHGNDQHGVIPSAKIPTLAKTASCLACHADEGKTLAASVHGAGGTGKKPGCGDCHPADPKRITTVDAPARRQIEAKCVTCHADLSKTLKDDVHARADKVPGDHPTCLSCHGLGHKIQAPAQLTPKQKVEVCATCHTDTARMNRYGVMPDTVEAYKATFHGRAILRLNRKKEATCVDCHGLHGILSSSNPKAPTHPRHAAEICGKCHEGNTKDFAFPYASHFRLKVEKSVVMPLDRVFSKILIGGVFFALLGMVVLGYRQRLCAVGNTKTAARMLEGYNCLSLLSMIIALVILATVFIMARLGIPDFTAHAWAAAGLLVLAVVSQLLKRLLPPCAPTCTEEKSAQ